MSLPCLLFSLSILLMVEMGPCPKSDTPEYFTERKAPAGEKAVAAAWIAGSAAGGIVMLAASLKGSTRDRSRG